MGPLMGAVAGPVAGALVGAAGSLFGASQAAKQSEYMYKHRYQWQVKDMMKAGLNPMLAFSQGAPVPNNPGVPDIGGSAARGAQVGSAVAAQKALLEAQKENLEADTNLKGTQSAANIATTRATAVQTGLVEPQLHYSAGNAYRQAEKLAMEVNLLARQAQKVHIDTKLADQQFLQQEQLQPLLVKYQELMNRVKAAELGPAEAEAAFWEALPEAKWVEKMRGLLPSFPKGVFPEKKPPNSWTPRMRR